MKTKIPTEAQEQKALMQWAAVNYFNVNERRERISDFLIHVPNGGKRSLLEALQFKRMGVQAGVPDLFLFVPNRKYNGLWIELKRSRGAYLSNEQQKFMVKLNRVGYATEVAYGWEKAKDYILDYLK